jgi:hypothetical protein
MRSTHGCITGTRRKPDGELSLCSRIIEKYTVAFLQALIDEHQQEWQECAAAGTQFGR